MIIQLNLHSIRSTGMKIIKWNTKNIKKLKLHPNMLYANHKALDLYI